MYAFNSYGYCSVLAHAMQRKICWVEISKMKLWSNIIHI